MAGESNDQKDAERYRWLLAQLQQAYDGGAAEAGEMSISCHMLFGRGSYRRVEANLHWSDQRDEPLDLSAAIDAAMLANPLQDAGGA